MVYPEALRVRVCAVHLHPQVTIEPGHHENTFLQPFSDLPIRFAERVKIPPFLKRPRLVFPWLANLRRSPPGVQNRQERMN